MYGLSRFQGVHDLNCVWLICDAFGIRRPGVPHECGQDAVCAGDGVCAVEDLWIYGHFLKESADAETRQYADPAQEIVVNFIHQNYISRKDIEFCLAFDLSPYEDEINFALLLSMHTTFCDVYAEEVA
jgi:hypothetical protein